MHNYVELIVNNEIKLKTGVIPKIKVSESVTSVEVYENIERKCKDCGINNLCSYEEFTQFFYSLFDSCNDNQPVYDNVDYKYCLKFYNSDGDCKITTNVAGGDVCIPFLSENPTKDIVLGNIRITSNDLPDDISSKESWEEVLDKFNVPSNYKQILLKHVHDIGPDLADMADVVMIYSDMRNN